ncbi:MAG: AEC family transporter [Clostridia bacterium]|nr:AEC family transporter [Clostridia bacterium]
MEFIPFLNTIGALFIMLSVGFFAGKIGIIDGVASKRLSKLIINIAQPALHIHALIGVEYSPETLKLGLISLGLGFGIHAFVAVAAFLACFKFKVADERKITELAMVFGNCGFIGIPIMRSLFGEEGAFMTAFFIVSYNVFLWTWGMMILGRGRTDIKLTVRKAFINLGTVPSAIGFVLFLMPFELPEFMVSSLGYISSLCTPVSMLIIGALLAGRTLKQIFCEGKAYYLCFFKLVAIPMAVCLIMKLLGFGDNWVLFSAAITAMPSATSVTMFAELHDISQGYSAQCVGTSSLLSLATMPLVIYLAGLVITI